MNPEQIMNIPKMIMIHFDINIINGSYTLRIKESTFLKQMINYHRTLQPNHCCLKYNFNVKDLI